MICIKIFFEKIKKIFCMPVPYPDRVLAKLKEKDYPKYLKKMFKYHLGVDLNLQNPHTFNEKIQWLKLNDLSPIKTELTDKVLVREWVKSKIDEKYLKPIFQVCSNFDEINFDKLPNGFIIKANHGCKWHYKIKDKEVFLKTQVLFDLVKRNCDAWMSQTYGLTELELQYRDIVPKILIEPILIDKDKTYPIEIEAYCFDGVPKVFQNIQYSKPPFGIVYDENLDESTLQFKQKYHKVSKPADELLMQVKNLSKILSKGFKFVRVDWLVYENNIYFNEMTFTPFSGFNIFPDQKTDEILGNLINLK